MSRVRRAPAVGDGPAAPWQTRDVNDVVRARPRRARTVCWITAAVVVVFFTLIATSLRGPTEGVGVFHTGDQVAMIALGLLGGAGILWFARPRVEADQSGIRVRNLLSSYDLPWAIVREIRFDRGNPWASLELADDDVVAVMAVQATDKDYAVETIRALRALHQAAGAASGGGAHG